MLSLYAVELINEPQSNSRGVHIIIFFAIEWQTSHAYVHAPFSFLLSRSLLKEFGSAGLHTHKTMEYIKSCAFIPVLWVKLSSLAQF